MDGSRPALEGACLSGDGDAATRFRTLSPGPDLTLACRTFANLGNSPIYMVEVSGSVVSHNPQVEMELELIVNPSPTGI